MRASLAATLLCLSLAPAYAEAAETVVSAARIHTMDAATPVVQALAFDDAGTVLALGDADALLQRYPGARHIDAGDATIIPGLIDAHGHVADLGWLRLSADLTDTTSREDVLARLREFAERTPGDGWIIGIGWDQNDWPEKRFPTAADLDAAFPERPVWLYRIDGHAGWANSAALRATGRDLAGDWQVDGGLIERDAAGKPTGILVDAAMSLVDRARPAATQDQRMRALELGMREAVANGLTGVHDAGISLDELQAYRQLADQDRMPLRVSAMAKGNGDALDALCRDGLYRHPSGRLQMRAVKLMVDGALGSRGAALLEDYSDAPGNRGLMVTSAEQLAVAGKKAKECGVQVATHAIGDRGNRVVLDMYRDALGKDAAGDHRWRIEHAQVLSAEDMPRLAALHVIASMQPTHATSDMPWAEERLGAERIVGAYAWRSLRDLGVPLALGSDFPVESVQPRLGLYAAVARAGLDGQPAGGWQPGQRLTAWEALRGFTRDAAFAGFEEDAVGSLSVGKRADFVVVDGDPLAMDAAGLATLRVLATHVDGQAVYEAPAGGSTD